LRAGEEFVMGRSLVALLFGLVLTLIGCGGGGSSSGPTPNNNDKLNGFYIVDLTGDAKFYMVLDGTGSMTQVGVFSPLNPPGYYAVSTADDFTITITNPVDGDILLAGTLTSLPSFSFTATQGGSSVGSGTIHKVTDIGACSGSWPGGSYNENGGARSGVIGDLTVTVDSTGAVTGGSIKIDGTTYSIVDRRLFCTVNDVGGIFTAFLVTSTTPSPSSYGQILLYGTMNGMSSVSGIYETDGNEFGTFSLVD
jgi:hypothetical protein